MNNSLFNVYSNMYSRLTPHSPNSQYVSFLTSFRYLFFFLLFQDRKNKSSKEFLTANRSLHWFPVAMSLMASFQSSVTLLGYPAEMYFNGTQFWVVIFSAILAAVCAAELFLPVYYGLSFTSVNKVGINKRVHYQSLTFPNYISMYTTKCWL